MGTNFQYSKTLAVEGSILTILGLIPTWGWVLGIIGVILLIRAMKEFAIYYQDNEIYQNALTGVKYYIVALIALGIAGTGFAVGFVLNDFPARFGVGNAVGLAVGVAFLIVAFVFYVLAATHLRKTFNTLALKTGEHSFETAGTLLWVGAILTIIGVGVGLGVGVGVVDGVGVAVGWGFLASTCTLTNAQINKEIRNAIIRICSFFMFFHLEF